MNGNYKITFKTLWKNKKLLLFPQYYQKSTDA